MKKLITLFLSFFSVLGAAPTGWAIYAGITKQSAFPVHEPWASIGAIAVITTTAAAGMLIVDILKHNSEAKDADEKKNNLPAWYGWAILAGCTLAEISLSLLVVIFPAALEYGVLAFTMVTVAAVFVLAVRMTLQERIADRIQTRAQQAQAVIDAQNKADAEAKEAQAKHEHELALRRELRRTAKESKQTATESPVVQLQSVEPPAHSNALASKYPRKCDYCNEQINSSNAVGGHMKKHHPELCKKTEKKPALAEALFTPATKEMTK